MTEEIWGKREVKSIKVCSAPASMGLKGNFPVHKEIAPELQENRQTEEENTMKRKRLILGEKESTNYISLQELSRSRWVLGVI